MSRDLGWFSGTSADQVLTASSWESFTPATWRQIREQFSSLNVFINAPPNKLSGVNLTESQRSQRAEPVRLEAIKQLLRRCAIDLILLGDKQYPKLLTEIPDPPLWLFYRGDLKLLRRECLTIVGSRKSSPYGLAALETIVSSGLIEQVCLVSGLAYGIDKKVHQLALQHKGMTIAVLAGGLDLIYPAAHTGLAHKILASGGLLLSEYPPLSRPRPFRFPIRNRILAGLSRLTVVVEAQIRSGSLTTAKSALDYNRDLGAVPGDITRQLAEGPNFLLSHGAMVVDSPRVLDTYFQVSESRSLLSVDNESAQLLNLLSDTEKSVDQLIKETDFAVDQILGLLTCLELEGLIYQPRSGQYLKKHG